MSQPTHTRYAILQGKNPDELKERVNTAIDNGWQPLGSIAVIYHNSELHFYQAVINNDVPRYNAPVVI
jgi:hypothetical protein